MNTAGDFSRGDRVEFTPEARAMFVGVATGTVVGFSRNGLNLRIRRDGNVKVVTYGAHLWRHSDIPAPEEDPKSRTAWICVGCDKRFNDSTLDDCLGRRMLFCEHCLIEHPCGGGR